jgi:integrase
MLMRMTESKKMIFETVLGLDSDWGASRYASVNRWVRALRRRGDRRATRRTYFKCLANFLRFLNLTVEENGELGDRRTRVTRRRELFDKVVGGMNPDRLIGLPKDEVEERIQVFCDWYNEKGKARSAHAALNCLRSFFKHNDVGELELDDYQWRKNRRPEYVPTKEDVYRMADRCDERGRAIILCTFQSGLRNSALRALKYGDVRDQLEAEKIPVTLHVDSRLRSRIPEACKEDAEYFTFFGREATQALREYVQWRIVKRGKIGNDEPLFLPYEAFNFKLGSRLVHASEDSLERLVKRAARRARIKEWRHVRFHSLRKSFRSVLDTGYVDGGQMPEDDKEFLMGHRLPAGKEPYHNANVTVLAQLYMRLNWADLARQAASVEELRKKQVLDMVKLLGFPDDKIKRIEETLAKHEKVDDAMEEIKKLSIGSYKENFRQHSSGFRIVKGEEKLVKSLNSGWDLVKELSEDKFVLKKTSDTA